MNNFQLILSKVEEILNSLPDWNNLSEFVSDFHNIWQKLGNFVQQKLVQAKIEQKEESYSTRKDSGGRELTNRKTGVKYLYEPVDSLC